MQKFRRYGDGAAALSQRPTIERVAPKLTQELSFEGQVVGSQSAIVQYPPG